MARREKREETGGKGAEKFFKGRGLGEKRIIKVYYNGKLVKGPDSSKEFDVVEAMNAIAKKKQNKIKQDIERYKALKEGGVFDKRQKNKEE